MSASQKPGLILWITFLVSVWVSGEDRPLCGSVIVPVNVLDLHGNPIKGQTKDSFRASYGRHPLKILDSTYSDKPRRLAILLDVSASMKGLESSHSAGETDKWGIASIVVRSTVLSAPQGTQISLMTFGSKASEIVPPTVGGGAVLKWLDSNPYQKPRELKGRTVLYDAILEAKRKFEPAQAGDAIYAITDGVENGSEVSAARVRRELQAAGTRFFIFLLEEDYYHSEEESRVRDVSSIVLQSGGFQMTIPPKRGLVPGSPTAYGLNDEVLAEVRSAAQVVNDQIRQFYLVTIDLSGPAVAPKKWKLELANTKGEAMKGLVLTYPHQFTSCSAQ